MPRSDRPRKKYVPKNNGKKEQNNCWDELNKLYGSCLELLATPMPIAGALRDKSAIAACRDIGALKNDAKILNNDVTEYKKRLEEIRAMHVGKTGGTDDPDQLMESLIIGENYQNWIMSFQSVVLPTVESLSYNLLGREVVVEEETTEGEATDSTEGETNE